MGYKGRHRAPSKSKAKLVLPVALVALLPSSIGLGYYYLATQTRIQVESVDPYAGTITIAAAPPAPTTLPAPHEEIPGTNHPTPSKGSSERPSESATGSPLSPPPTSPPPTHQEKDQEAPTASSEPPIAKVSSKCNNLASADSVVRACNALMVEFPDIDSMGGKGTRPENPTSCHPFGLGLDVMVSDEQLGDAISSWAHTNREKYGIAWIGWKVPDHYDHVHISFDPCKG